MIITEGDTVTHYDTPGLAVAIPNYPGQFMASFGYYALIFDEAGDDPQYPGTAVVTRQDPAKVAWDALSPCVREVLHYTGLTRKSSAIRALCSLTGLGLTDAKRAIECFTT